MLTTVTIEYECGCSIPMNIDIFSKPMNVKVNGYWFYESKICPKHTQESIEKGRNWNS